MPLHMTLTTKNIKVAWGRGVFPDELSDNGGLYIPQRPKQVNLSTEVVKGVVPKWVSKWYMVRVVPKGSTEMWYRGWYRNTHTHYYSYITTIYIFFFNFFFL